MPERLQLLHCDYLRVDDPADVRAFVDADPYVANGLVTDWRVEPWNVVT